MGDDVIATKLAALEYPKAAELKLSDEAAVRAKALPVLLCLVCV